MRAKWMAKSLYLVMQAGNVISDVSYQGAPETPGYDGDMLRLPLTIHHLHRMTREVKDTYNCQLTTPYLGTEHTIIAVGK